MTLTTTVARMNQFDIIAVIIGQSYDGVQFSTMPSPTYPGFTSILRKVKTDGPAVLMWSFLFPGIPGGAAYTGAATDANPTGALIALVSPDGVSSKADVVAFVNSLK
jgi:hypothetical protein